MSIGQVRLSTIHQRQIKGNSAGSDFGANFLWDFAQSRRHFQEGKVFCSGCLGNTLHHLSRSGNPAEPSVNAAEDGEQVLDFTRRTTVGIENLVCVDSLQ